MEKERENMAVVVTAADPARYPADSGLYSADLGPRDAIFRDVISRDVISRDIISFDTISFDTISRDVIFCNVISCDAISRDAISCDVISGDAIPSPSSRDARDPPGFPPLPYPLGGPELEPAYYTYYQSCSITWRAG